MEKEEGKKRQAQCLSMLTEVELTSLRKPCHGFDDQHSRVDRFEQVLISRRLIGFDCELGGVCRNQHDDGTAARFAQLADEFNALVPRQLDIHQHQGWGNQTGGLNRVARA